MEKKIFISYRRSDSACHAGRIYDNLVNHFGEERIFMDVVTIKPGVDFSKEIETTLKLANAVIVLIGNSWLNIRDDNDQAVKISDMLRLYHYLEILLRYLGLSLLIIYNSLLAILFRFVGENSKILMFVILPFGGIALFLTTSYWVRAFCSAI
jgi:hypothetical protein